MCFRICVSFRPLQPQEHNAGSGRLRDQQSSFLRLRFARRLLHPDDHHGGHVRPDCSGKCPDVIVQPKVICTGTMKGLFWEYKPPSPKPSVILQCWIENRLMIGYGIFRVKNHPNKNVLGPGAGKLSQIPLFLGNLSPIEKQKVHGCKLSPVKNGILSSISINQIICLFTLPKRHHVWVGWNNYFLIFNTLICKRYSLNKFKSSSFFYHFTSTFCSLNILYFSILFLNPLDNVITLVFCCRNTSRKSFSRLSYSRRKD